MLLFFDLFFEKFSKKYIGFFREFSPREFFPYGRLFVGGQSLERLLALCLWGFIVFSTCLGVPPRVLRLIPRTFDNVFTCSLSRLRLLQIIDECFCRRFFICSSNGNIERKSSLFLSEFITPFVFDLTVFFYGSISHRLKKKNKTKTICFSAFFRLFTDVLHDKCLLLESLSF